MGPVGSHGVGRGNGTQGHGVLIGALIAHHAHRADSGEQNDACLPHLIIQRLAVGVDIIAQSADVDVVGVLQYAHLLGRDVAENADGQAGTREGMSGNQVLGHTKLAPNAAHLVLKEPLQRLAELEVHLLGQSADVVMALDDLARDVQALDAVGVDGALGQPLGISNLLGFGIEHLDEVAADDLALLLRLGDTGEVSEELL